MNSKTYRLSTRNLRHFSGFNPPLAAVAVLIAASPLFAQTTLPTGENLPFAFPGRSVPQLLGGANGFRFSLPANTVYAAVKLQTVSAAEVQLLVRRGQEIAGTANNPVFDIGDTSRGNKRVQIGVDSRLPIASDQPYFIALRVAESAEPIAGILRLDVRTMTSGGTVVEFSGLADVRLAGQPDGASVGGGATAPLNSPPGPIAVTAGQGIRFQAVGNSTQSATRSSTGPEGDGYGPNCQGIDFGLSGFCGPTGGVIGVFTGPSVIRNDSTTPRTLNFASDLRERTILRPGIQQFFFVGSGLNSDGEPKTFVIPAGATRLFLGRSYAMPYGIGRTVVRVEAVPSSAIPAAAPANPVRVSGATSLFLAGQPEGTRVLSETTAPNSSPAQLAVSLVPGQALIFRANGLASASCNRMFYEPAGAPGVACGIRSEAGISGYDTRAGALVGVFLGANSTPTVPASIDYTGGVADLGTLRPQLQQSFLIGNGMLADGSDRRILVPPGATRLFVAPSAGDGNQVGFFTVSVSADIADRPAYTKSSVVNGATFEAGAVSPGSIISIFGQNLGKESSGSTVPLPRSLGGTQVFFDTIPAPLYFVTPGQINAQVPWELGAAAKALLTVVRDGVAGTAIEVDLYGYRPGIFSAPNIGALLVNSNTGIPVTAQTPARQGDVLIGYATGLGLTAANPLTGQPDPGAPLATGALNTTIVVTGPSGEINVTPLFAGLAPGFVGVFQMNFAVPPGLGSGMAKLRLESVPFGASGTTEFAVDERAESGGPPQER